MRTIEVSFEDWQVNAIKLASPDIGRAGGVIYYADLLAAEKVRTGWGGQQGGVSVSIHRYIKMCKRCLGKARGRELF